MKRVIILSALLLTGAFIIGCPPSPINPTPNMICEPIYDTEQCIDSSYPQSCISSDGTRCGFKVMGQYFYCAYCEPVVCDEAAMMAVSFCYGYYYYSTGNVEITEQVVDESSIPMKVVEFMDSLELLKEANQ